jgi:4-aminobutyrate aminotransferase-like enzyme/Ser/Thr protein kinase RdoA (MazF antagonist)
MLLLEHTPQISIEAAIEHAREVYGISATATLLSSERDQNFLLGVDGEDRFLLKIANALESRTILEAQQQAMMHITREASSCPGIVFTLNGDAISEIQAPSGSVYFAQLLTYLPGVTLGSVKRHSPELLYDLGFRLGELDRILATFDHPAIHRKIDWDLKNGLEVARKYGPLIRDEWLRKLVIQLMDEFERDAAPLLSKLRASAIYNDANDHNIIVGGGSDLYTRDQSVVGFIDFGDIVHSYTVCDLAIAVAYAMLKKPDPLAAAARVVRGYHASHPLTDYEFAALFWLVRMRLCMSVCMAAHHQRQRPDDDYLAISQEPIRDILPDLAQIHPRFAEAIFRRACGLPSSPKSGPVTDWLRARAGTFASVLNVDIHTAPSIVFDLSVGSPFISGDESQNTEPELTRRLFSAMQAAGVEIGIGRYGEPRLVYTSSMFGSSQKPTDERRTIHLGIDVFAKAGDPIYAPLEGSVCAFNNNSAPQDYGPVIILKHSTEDGDAFYTLYGHLSEQSLIGLSVGKPVAKGEQLATIGAPDVNGGWTPHLHFQIILDLLELGCDFPGVALPSQREAWLSFSPDPNLILGIPEDRFPAAPPDKTETLRARRNLIGRNVVTAYREPLKIARGWMQYLYDEQGRAYLDAYNNVPHVGHCHPAVVKAGCEQMSALNTNTRYLHDLINLYAEQLCSLLPDPLKVCFFVNSGSEANELALRLARAHTGQRDMIVMEGAYHGHTNALIDISPYKNSGPGGGGAPAWVHTVPVPDSYRGVYRDEGSEAGNLYLQSVIDALALMRRSGAGLAGYIAESCPSVAGQIILPEGYLKGVYGAVRDAGGICIADEVQTGYGRIGTHFWGYESQGVAPDIVVLGKPIGNGHPIGAVITTPEIASSFDNGMEFFSTFGGNTVSCAIGLAVLRAVLDQDLQSHALRVGNHLIEGLRRLKNRYSIIGDARGSGLFIGVEMVRNRETLEPATEEAAFITNQLRERGVLVGVDGQFRNVIKIRPPMPFSETDADSLVEAMDSVLNEDAASWFGTG